MTKYQPLQTGFHIGVGGNQTGLGDYFRRLDAAGIPATVMSADAMPYDYQEIARNSDVKHFVGYRSAANESGIVPPSGDRNVPRYTLPPDISAQEHTNWHINHLPPELDGSITWFTDVNEGRANEADHPGIFEWWAEYSIKAANIALNRGYKYIALNFAAGNHPLWSECGPKMKELYQLAADNPHRLMIGTHEYSWKVSDIMAGNGSLVGRITKELLDHMPDVPCVVTEWGWSETGVPEPEKAMQDILQVANTYYNRSGLKHAAIWYLGPQYKGIADKAQKLIKPLTELTLNTQIEIEEGDTVETTPQKIFQISQAWAFPVNEDAALQKVALYDGYTPSGVEEWHEVDGVRYAMQPFYKIGDTDKKRSYYATVGEWGNVKWTDGSNQEFVLLNVPHLTQVANLRLKDCGAACAAMVARLAGQSPTVDEVAIAYQNPPNSNMHFNQVDQALNGYGMDGVQKKPFYPEEIAQSIRDGQPVIALVHYPALPQQFYPFDGSHFIVCYGVSGENIAYRDPLQVTEGAPLIVSFDGLKTAMAQVVHDGNMAYQGMVCSIKDTPPPTGETYNTADFMIPDPRSWVVVDRAAAGGEDIWHLFKDGEMIRVKNRIQAEWYTSDGLKRIRDTSPQDDPTYGPSLYLQHTNGVPGGQIAPAICQVGVTYEYFSDVQFKRKSDCKNLDYRSGNGRSTFQLKGVLENHTFQNGVTVDKLFVTVQTGEVQLYAIKDGVKRGWCGGGAEQAGNVWAAVPSEFHLGRAIPQEIPPTYCG